MKHCPSCKGALGEEVVDCPVCGQNVGKRREYVDDYRILEFVHEAHGTSLYRARREGEDRDVLIRLFKPESGMDEEKAARLTSELEQLRALSPERFVRHYAIKKSCDGLCYRVSEWIDATAWGDLIASGYLLNYQAAFKLFAQIASALAELHDTGHIIPHLILYDVLVHGSTDQNLTVKIDYKLSRFLDPKLDKPCSMLKKLLECHPDILNARPLDSRSDVWSLGKIFVELLSNNMHDASDYLAELDKMPLPQRFKILFTQMLDTDPDLRPGSMDGIASELRSATREEIEETRKHYEETITAPVREVRGLKRIMGAVAAVLVLPALAGLVLQFQYGFFSKDDSRILSGYAERYKNAVAYVLVEYRLDVDGKRAYRGGGEGTAFLVDSNGYLLTNRHVACPWLKDQSLRKAIIESRNSGKLPEFKHRILLWFEGENAFLKRDSNIAEETELADAFNMDTAFRSDGTPSLTTAGVLLPPSKTLEAVRSPLNNDIAVLKIDKDKVPRGITPITLDVEPAGSAVGLLSPVMIMGFPRGRATIFSSQVRVSTTMGHIRRAFDDGLQMDASVHPGNSGGPVIGVNGRAIGITSATYGDSSDFGMAIRIARASSLLEELKEGRVKWDGVIDPAADMKVRKVYEEVDKGRWKEAMDIADEECRRRADPELLTLAGIMHLCNRDISGSRRGFRNAISIDSENGFAKFMLYMLDRKEGRSKESKYRPELLRMDWRSSNEFYGFLTAVLEGMIHEESALKGWETRRERALLRYTAATNASKDSDYESAEENFREALLSVDTDSPEYLLIKFELEVVQQARRGQLLNPDELRKHEKEIACFRDRYQKASAAQEEQKAVIEKVYSTMDSEGRLEGKAEAYRKIAEVDPENRSLLVVQAFCHAVGGDWKSALKCSDEFQSKGGRESGNRLGMGLFHAQLLYALGRQDEAMEALRSFANSAADPWYGHIAKCLLGETTTPSARDEAGGVPENLVTLHTALGFKAEADGNREEAIKHYNLALESYLDSWIEYQFARERLAKLRKEGKT